MPLDPVHVEGVADIARHIRHDVDEERHRDLAAEVWANFLDPLYDGDTAVLEPLGEQRRTCADATALGLDDGPFETVHGLDSGTVNERVFHNGLTIDVAQAAMSSLPTDLDLRQSRTIVTGVHTNDATVDLDSEWQRRDGGHARFRALEVPDLGATDRVVHWLTLYHAETEHALAHAEDVTDLLVLDGPLYPKELVNWAERRRGLAALVAAEPHVETVVENYLRLVESFLERGVPLVGFVKGARADGLVRALSGTLSNAPWATDLSLFSQVLERHEGGERVTSELSWTNWFVSRLGADGAFAGDADPGVARRLDPDAYEVAFFVVYDSRTDLAFRVELPRGFAADEATREAVRRHVVAGVAAQQGPPPAVAKADEIAGIGAAEKRSLVEELERSFDSREDRSYDDERWRAG